MVEFDPDKWITLSEAAWIRGVKKQAMSQLAKRERFEPLKIGWHVFIKKSDVDVSTKK